MTRQLQDRIREEVKALCRRFPFYSRIYPYDCERSRDTAMTKGERPDWDAYFMEIAGIVAKRSTCVRRNVGALIVKDRRILVDGLQRRAERSRPLRGPRVRPRDEHVASGERHELCRGLHAEQNAIIQAAYHGVSIKGAALYPPTCPAPYA